MNLSNLYQRLIETAAARNGRPPKRSSRKAGFEIHHYIPKSVGGTDDPANLVYLTPREHYTAHHILARLFGAGIFSFSFYRMSQPDQGNTGRSYTVTARQYETARLGLVSYLKNRKYSEDSLAKMREGQQRRFREQGVSEETRSKLSAAGMGRTPDEATRQKLREANKRQYSEDLICPHCGKSGKSRVMARWHFDRCKALTGKAPDPTTYPKLTCPYCSTLIGSNIAHRYHFENCKHKPLD